MDTKTPKTKPKAAKHEPALLGMAADMKQAEAEVFNPLQLAMLRRHREVAERIAQYDCTGPSTVITLKRRGYEDVEPEPEVVESYADMQHVRYVCPHCGRTGMKKPWVHVTRAHRTPYEGPMYRADPMPAKE